MVNIPLFCQHYNSISLRPKNNLFGGGIGGCVLKPDELQPLASVLAAAWGRIVRARVPGRGQRCRAVGLLSSWQPWGSAPGFASAEAWQHGKMGYHGIASQNSIINRENDKKQLELEVSYLDKSGWVQNGLKKNYRNNCIFNGTIHGFWLRFPGKTNPLRVSIPKSFLVIHHRNGKWSC